MHEQSLMADLLKKIISLSEENASKKIQSVKVKLGALAHISASHLKEHFVQAAQGTCAEDARLEVEVLHDLNDPHAQDILLESIEIEE